MAAEQAASGNQLNVVNNSVWLFDRYEFFRERYLSLHAEAERRKDERDVETKILDDGTEMRSTRFPSLQLYQEAEWHAQAAIDAFFCWTEHVFIHIAILLGRLRTGEDVAALAQSDWKEKFKSVLDISDPTTQRHYDRLLDLRAQIRNFMAHGSFGKRGEAFRFHSGAGAVPVLLTGKQKHRYALTGEPAFDERWAIGEIDAFIEHLWSGPLLPARRYVESHLPCILTYVSDGSYHSAMQSEEAMDEFVRGLSRAFDDAANMDW